MDMDSTRLVIVPDRCPGHAVLGQSGESKAGKRTKRFVNLGLGRMVVRRPSHECGSIAMPEHQGVGDHRKLDGIAAQHGNVSTESAPMIPFIQQVLGGPERAPRSVIEKFDMHANLDLRDQR